MNMNLSFMAPNMPGLQQMGGTQQPLVKNLPVLYVGDLEELVTEEMLFNYFSKFGYIYSVRVMRDSNNKKSRGFAFVSFYVLREAENAKINANHDKILQNPIRVTWKKSPRDMNPDANIFVKNLDPTVTVKTLDSFFSQYGAIFTSKIATKENGESLGYGYVQFEQKESAVKCLEVASDLKINDQQISVVAFKKRVNREEQKKNLYLKNFPALPEADIEAKLREVCKQFGPVTSLLVKTQKDSNKPFAFVCFEHHEDAVKAQTELPQLDPFNVNQNLYANWSEKKNDRTRKLKDVFSKTTNETNLFTKNLKPTVTSEQLQKALEVFGAVTSCKICVPAEKVEKKFQAAVFAYINFKTKEDARIAFMKAKDDEIIKDLYNDKSPYLAYHLKKDQLIAFKDQKKRQLKQIPNMMNMDPFYQFFFQQQQNRPGMRGMSPMQQQFMMPFNPQMMQMGGMGMPNRFQGGMGSRGGQNFPNYQQNFQGNYQHQNQSLQPQRRQHNNNNQYNQPQQRGNSYNNQNQNRQYGRQYQSDGRQYHQGNRQNYQQRNNQQSGAQSQQQAQKASTVAQITTVANLKEHMKTFLDYDKEKQRTLLGELLFPLVRKCASEEQLAPKITGMLIDFDVFDVTDIIEFLDSEEQLKERVAEAEELIKQSSGQTEETAGDFNASKQ